MQDRLQEIFDKFMDENYDLVFDDTDNDFYDKTLRPIGWVGGINNNFYYYPQHFNTVHGMFGDKMISLTRNYMIKRFPDLGIGKVINFPDYRER
jgi:hypothetical protein